MVNQAAPLPMQSQQDPQSCTALGTTKPHPDLAKDVMPAAKRKKIPLKRAPWVITAGFQAIYHPTLLLPPKNCANHPHPPRKVKQFSGKEFCSPDSLIFRVPQQRVVLHSQGLYPGLGRQRCSTPSTNTPLCQRKHQKQFFLAGTSRGSESILSLGLFVQLNAVLMGFAVCWAQSRSCLPAQREAGWKREAGIATVPTKKIAD